jgi:hypothetical protein
MTLGSTTLASAAINNAVSGVEWVTRPDLTAIIGPPDPGMSGSILP